VVSFSKDAIKHEGHAGDSAWPWRYLRVSSSFLAAGDAGNRLFGYMLLLDWIDLHRG
jgi:hypothetical protein